MEAVIAPDKDLRLASAKWLSLAERYIPRAFAIPMNAGFRWFLQWSSSPIKQSLAGAKGKLWSPLHRMQWDIFSARLWDKATILGAQGMLD